MPKTLEILKRLEENEGIPFAYDHYAEGEAPSPPFIAYLYPSSDNFAADGKVYLHVQEVRIELYTDHKDVEMERKLEQALGDAGIFWEKAEAFIAEEKLYMVTYSFEEVNYV